MASLKALKIRIGSVKSTQKITKAMKTVAAAKLRRATEAAVAARPYASRLEAVMASLAATVTLSDSSPKLLTGNGKDQVHLLVVATSERGLAGGFNTNIVRLARRKADELIAQGKTVRFYLAGRKARVLARFYPAMIHHDRDMSGHRTPGFAIANDLAADLIARFDAGEFDVAHLFYSNFRSALVQEPVAQQIIPVPLVASDAAKNDASVEYEPDEESILADLLPRNIAIQLYRAMLENNAGFYGAQMTAMDNATRNAGDMINRLTIQYNRTRQAAITTELVEIISGAEAL
ncbi:MAG: F0F1 ATP synthase subunit gamma [Sphingomonas sp.]|uniref:F0F1 ATP synthase subunit gamma n=1 Tax=Sphingomonas sp. TaxID=28214 RepID=UPI00182B60B5|nr:F0F1 ATP synthase subunit gamma [Sphingobium sp.]MBA4771712.1 F0F1 ATP synthase subunit gamma [Sphingomonas sp.]